jgi:hypothetical protein
MSLLRIFRNLAVLLIVAVAFSALKTPEARAFFQRCGNVGQQCISSYYRGCCPGLVCIPASTRAFCYRLQ